MKLNGFCYKQLLFQQVSTFTVVESRDGNSTEKIDNESTESEIAVDIERVYKILDKLKDIDSDDDNHVHWKDLKSKINSPQLPNDNHMDDYELKDMFNDNDFDSLEMDNDKDAK